jgi:DNA-binding XRE family transcriptional regulator
MNPTIKVQSVRVLSSSVPHPDYRLSVSFSDGTRGTADLGEHVKRKPFLALQDANVFRQAQVERGAVEWPGDVGIAPEALYALAHGLPRPTSGEQARANELEVSLRELRRIAGKTQNEIAEETGLTQGAISHLEREDDHKLSTLRKYVAALGAELEVVAVLGDKRIALRGV